MADYTPTTAQATPATPRGQGLPASSSAQPGRSNYELNARSSESVARHISYNVMLDQMEELRSIASGNDYRNSRAGPLSPQPQSVNDPSLYRGYDGASEYGRAGDGVRPSMPLPTPSQRAFETIGSPPLTDVPVISVPGSVVNAQTSRSGPMAMSQLPQSYSATSLGLGLGLVGVAPSASGQPQTPYTQYGGGQSQQQSPYVSRRDGYEDGDYDDEDSYAGARAMDLYSEGIQSPAVPPTSARYDNYGRGRGDYRASSARTHPETDRTMVDYDRRGRSYLADPGPYSQSRAGYPQTPGGARSMVPPDESIDGSRAARYYYKRPSGKPVVWWRRSICHFIGLAMSALCAFWLLNWIFGGMSWTFRSKQISLVVGIETQSTDDNYQLVNYTLVSPIDSELAGALAVDYIYGSTRDQVVSMVDSDQRYAGFWVSQDYSTSLLSRSVPAVVEYIHDSGKNYKTVRDLLFSMMLFNEKLRVAIATEFVKQNVTASVGYWLTGPVKISYTDLHPVSTEGQNIFAYMTTLLLWFGCIFIATVTSWMTHPQSPMRATEFGWRLLGAGTMLLLLTAGTSAVPLILNGQFAGIGNSGAGWAAAWGWMMLVGISFLGIISFTYQLAGRDLGQALMVVFGFIQFGTAWALLDQNLSFLVYQVGKGFPMYWSIAVLRFIFFGSLSSYLGVAVAVIISWILAMCSLSILIWFMGWNSVGQNMQKTFSDKVWLGDPKLLGLDDDKTEVYSNRE